MSEISANPRFLAVQWLKEEDNYQWRRGEKGKFKHAQNVARTYGLNNETPWDVLLLGYLGPAYDPHLRVSMPRTIQNIGKAAATGRALLVTLRTLGSAKSADAAWRDSNKKSKQELSTLAQGINGVGFHDWRQEHSGDTQFWTQFRVVDNNLPLAEGTVPDKQQIVEAQRLQQYGVILFSGIIAHAVREGIDLPMPGVSRSEDITPWDYQALLPR